MILMGTTLLVVSPRKRRGSAEQVMQELAPESYLQEPNTTLENLSFN